jgi:hypothetical protein
MTRLEPLASPGDHGLAASEAHTPLQRFQNWMNRRSSPAQASMVAWPPVSRRTPDTDPPHRRCVRRGAVGVTGRRGGPGSCWRSAASPTGADGSGQELACVQQFPPDPLDSVLGHLDHCVDVLVDVGEIVPPAVRRGPASQVCGLTSRRPAEDPVQAVMQVRLRRGQSL